MRNWFNIRRVLYICLGLLAVHSVSGITVSELRAKSKLTPEEFAACFRDFQFVFHSEIQDPDVFLSTKSGDCDDYATLASTVLREKGYTPRLIAVRMPGIVHVVCYIEETHTYLDYNKRHSRFRTIKVADSISEIARKVAKSFEAPWTSASEFTYNGQAKQLVATVQERQPISFASRKTSVDTSNITSLQ